MRHSLTRPDKENALLTLGGGATIRHADEIKTVFEKALKESGCLTVNIKNVTDADISFLQLVCAAHKTVAGRADQSLRLVGLESLAKIAPRAYQHVICGTGDSNNCLLTAEEKNDY